MEEQIKKGVTIVTVKELGMGAFIDLFSKVIKQ